MSSIVLLQNNFLAGELSPKLEGRSDLPAYQNGCRTMENFLPMKNGGFRRRPGTYYIGDPAATARLIPWTTSAGTCILELTALSARLWTTAHALYGSPAVVVTPWSASDIAAIDYVANGDEIYLVHPSYAPRLITYSAGTFTLSTPSFSGARTFSATGDYPAVVDIYQGRLLFAATNNEPRTIFMSRTFNTATGAYRFTDFTTGSTSDYAVIYTIPDGVGSSIRWTAVHKLGLMAGTDRSVWQNTATLASDITMQPIAYVPCAPQKALKSGNVVLYLGYVTPTLRILAYSSDSESFADIDASRFSDHILKPSVLEIAAMMDPDQVAFLARSDGTLCAATIDTQGGLSVGWSRQVLADDGLVESVAVARGTSGDELWMVVNRDGNRRMEYLSLAVEDDDFEEIHYLDSGLRKTYATPTKTITGLTHLEGKVVSAIGDGGLLPSKTVASGQVTYSKGVSTIHIGLPYTSTVKPERPEIALNNTWQGKTKQVLSTTLRLYRSYGGQAGPDEDNLMSLAYVGLEGQDLGDPPAPFTGDAEVPSPGTVDTDGAITCVQDKPFPFTVLAMMTRIALQEG